MRRVDYRKQRTVARPVEVQGTGYLTGASVRLRFVPAPPHTGVVFVRTDLPGAPQIPARIEHVTGTQRRTTLGNAPASVSVVEHALAALAGLRIDNCYVEVDAPEAPGLDGSAHGFVTALRQAGTCTQPALKAVWCLEHPVVVRQNGATLALHPTPTHTLRISYLLDYGPGSPIDRQMHTATVTPESFSNDLASCRTFLLEEEAIELRRQGLGRETRISDLLVFGRRGPIDNRLRFANEPARHKVLDVVGDLALSGAELCGHVVAYRSGHPLNVELARVLGEACAQVSVGKRAA